MKFSLIFDRSGDSIDFETVYNADLLEYFVQQCQNNDKVNFSFGYTYVGRQYYNKWQFFDSDLECKDHYNYETLEYAFQINLDRPQTIPYSREFLAWSHAHGVPTVSTQTPIANAVDLERNLKHYRTILFENSVAGNRASIKIH